MSRARLTRTEMLEAADSIRRLLNALHAGELTAPPMLVARLEGALVAVEVIATGRAPTPDDFLGVNPLHDTKVFNKLGVDQDQCVPEDRMNKIAAEMRT